MNYCGNCGSKLTKDSKFCSKCGNPTELGIKKINEENEKKFKQKQKRNEEKVQKLILNTGISLIVIASLIFTLFSFKNISDLFKVIFLFVESIVFIYISILLKKNTKSGYKALFAIGVIIIPIILILLTSNSLLGAYSFMNGAGIYIYLSISFLLCSVIYLLSYKFIKSKLYLYLSYIFLNSSVIFFVSIINEVNNISRNISNNVEFTSLLGFNLIILIILSIKKDSILLKTFINYLRLFLVIAYIYFMVLIFINNPLMFKLIDMILYLAISYIVIIKSINSNSNAILPVFINLVTIVFINNLLSNYNNVSIFVSVLAILLIFFINYLVKNKCFKILNYIVTILSTVIMFFIASHYSYKVLLICSIITLLSSLFIYKIEEEKSYKNIISTLIIANIYIIVYSLIKTITLTKSIYIPLIASIIYSLIYVILKTKNIKIYKTYEFISYALILISSLSFNNYNLVFNILNEIVWVYYFTLKLLFDDESDIRNLLLAFTIINLFLILVRFDIKLYYVLLSFAMLFTFIGMISYNIKKLNKKVFDILSIILILLTTLFNFNNYIIMALCINILLYCYIYISIFKDKNINFIFKFIYTLAGFIIIYKLFGYFINVDVISSLLSIITFILIIITMYLMRVDDDRKIMCYLITLFYPYYVLISNINILSEYSLSLLLTPILIFYIFIFSEKIIKFNDNSLKNIFQIIFLSVIYLIILSNLHNGTIIYIYSLLLSVIYVIYGILKNNSSIITFGCITLLLTTILLFFQVSNSLVIVFSILFIGVSLITYISMKESKKH